MLPLVQNLGLFFNCRKACKKLSCHMTNGNHVKENLTNYFSNIVLLPMCIRQSSIRPFPFSLGQWISCIIVYKPLRAKVAYVSSTAQYGLPRPLGVRTSIKITSRSSRVWSNDYFILGCSSALNVTLRLATLHQPRDCHWAITPRL